MRPFALLASRSLPGYAAVAFAVLTAISSLPALSGPLRLLPSLFLALAYAFSLVSIFLGPLTAKATGLASIVVLTWAIFNTSQIGNAGLFLVASGAWFWLGLPITILAGIACAYLNKSGHPK